MQSSINPFFVVFEGVDCSGKTTAYHALIDYLIENTITFVAYTEKLFEPVADKIFKVAETPSQELQLLYWWTARRKALESAYAISNPPSVILFDRYYDSTFVYQNISLAGPEFRMTYNSNFFPKPDLTFYLKCNIDTILERLTNFRSNDINDPYENKNKMQQYISRYNMIYDLERNDSSIEKIDANQPLEIVKHNILKLFDIHYSQFLNEQK